MARESIGTAAATAVAMIALVAAYFGSYFALVEKRLEGPGWHKLEAVAGYGQIDCPPVRAVYFPIHAIDRRVRRQFWAQPLNLRISFEPKLRFKHWP